MSILIITGLMISFNICNAIDLNYINITVKGQLTFSEAINAMKKQTGLNILVLEKYKEMTIEVDMENKNITDALQTIVTYVNNKYSSDLITVIEGDAFILKNKEKYEPKPFRTKIRKLKYISCKDMQKIIFNNTKNTKFGIDKSLNALIYSIYDEKDEIKPLIDKYDVELNTCENILLNIRNSNYSERP